MEAFLDKLDDIEERVDVFGGMRIIWDYGDIYWSIQFQEEYQPEVLERVIDLNQM
ncbi:MAG: hypothetical protein ACFFE4_20910 [Candidatus Thorarchaeota archaeon]